MRLRELLENILRCYAFISITGLCDEYRGGVDSLMKEPWFEKAADQVVKGFDIIGFDRHDFELHIVI